MTTALVIIDLQNDILKGLGSPERQPLLDRAVDAVVARMAALQRSAREKNLPVIVVQHDGSPEHRLGRGKPGWELRPEIAPQENDVLIHKQASDSFFETGLDAVLKAKGVTRIVLGGCMSQYCVDTTARRAVTLGYDVTLVADGHATADEGALSAEQISAHHNLLLDGFGAGGRTISVMKADEVGF
ncbi:MAG: cysteine hydrolase family protein [Oceanibaculum sp.]|jgi:nicotinamidase-related amidase